MYTYKQDETTLAMLRQVKVDVIKDRSGQLLRNFLLATMTEESNPSNRYLLKVDLTEVSRRLGFRRDRTSRYEEITLTAYIRLENMDSGKVEFSDVVKEVASFSIGSQARTASYSGSVAEESSRERALKVLADTINLRVSGHLVHASNAPNVTPEPEVQPGEETWMEG